MGCEPPSEPSGRIKIRRPRGATACAGALEPAMNIVRGCGPDCADPIRVPQAPQNANPACTPLPQFGQTISPPGAGPPVGLVGAGVVDGWIPPPVDRAAGAGPASGFGGS